MKNSEPLRGLTGERRYTLRSVPPLPAPVAAALKAGRLTHAVCLEAASPALLRDTALGLAGGLLCRQGGGSGLARRAGHTHIGHLLRRCGQRRAQFFRRGEPLRQSSKILICLFDGHCVNPRFDVYRAGCTSG